MLEVKRMVFYIYEYQGEERRKNIGYMKLNLRGEDVKIQIHIKETGGQGSYKSYLYLEKNGLEGIYLGELKAQNSGLEWNGSISTKKILETSVNIEQIKGLYIEDGTGHFYSGNFADENIKTTKPKLYKEKVQDIVEASVEIEAEQEEKIIPEEISREDKWSYLEKRYPVKKFQDGDKKELMVIQLTVREMGRLPRDQWNIGNNSFLLHGCYRYKHILICKEIEENETTYLVGVPGLYNDHEKMLAKMFGFETFKMIASNTLGYWCRRIE